MLTFTLSIFEVFQRYSIFTKFFLSPRDCSFKDKQFYYANNLFSGWIWATERWLLLLHKCMYFTMYILQFRTRAIFVEQSLVSLFCVPMMYSVVSIVTFLLIAARNFHFKVNVNSKGLCWWYSYKMLHV